MLLELKLPDKKEVTDEQQKNYCASIFAVFPRLEQDIKDMMYEQLVTTYSEGIAISKTKEERDHTITRGNGIMEGMAILLEKWRLANDEHIAVAVEDKERS